MTLAKKISSLQSLSLLFLTLLLFAALTPLALAQETTTTATPPAADTNGITPNDIANIRSEGFTIVPANPNTINSRKFIFEIRPGESSNDFVSVQNLSNQPVKFLLYGADPTFSAQGTPAYKTRQSGGNGEGSWIKFDNQEFTLQPNEQRIERFTITVPKEAELGEHRAGITIEKSKADVNNPNITIATRVILHADIKVTLDPQPVPKMDGSFSASIVAEKPSWQTYYFWISLALFLISLTALLAVTLKSRPVNRPLTSTPQKPVHKINKPTAKTITKPKTSKRKPVRKPTRKPRKTAK